MPAAVAPPPITPLSTMATVKPARSLVGTGSAHDARTNDSEVERLRAHRRLIGEKRNGSAGSMINSGIGGDESGSLDGWVNLIIPDGYRAFKEAANDALLAPDLSSRSLPQPRRQASFALVPVPQGERS